MNRAIGRWNALPVAAFLCCVIASGCSPAFAGRVDFQAPPGWIHSNDPTAGETWIKPDGSRQSIMAQTTTTPLPLHEHGWKDIKICNNHPASLMVQRRNSGEVWEAVSTNWNAHRYMAVYVRPSSIAPDRAAEASIRTICLKPK